MIFFPNSTLKIVKIDTRGKNNRQLIFLLIFLGWHIRHSGRPSLQTLQKYLFTNASIYLPTSGKNVM